MEKRDLRERKLVAQQGKTPYESGDVGQGSARPLWGFSLVPLEALWHVHEVARCGRRI